ncbi:DMT family transporter [uncultured Muribaculum sp.]|jgi:drug/metabolite transporter (DMT)-like permease|uniref:DMT family transporter n=1 Tax=uncultured Muribaculum sp. TaxID=1918613 RepID=UPI0025AFAB30|nr:DMT family transporter [uncultured Muribaculum sp.]
MLLSNKAKGYILGAIAAATYGMNPLFALPLYADGMDADSVLFFRYMMAIPVMGLLLRIRGHSFSLASGRLAELAVLGVVVALSSLLLFLSYNYMDSGVASTLLFVYPVMVALIMAFRYGERLPPVTVVCIAVTLVGIMMLNRTAAGAGLSATGIWMVMLSSAAYAVYIVAINRPRFRDIPTLKVIFYVLLFGVSVFAVRILFNGALTLPSQWYMWGCLLALALLPTAVSFFCTTLSIQYIGPTPTAILGALEPVVAIFVAVAVFGDILTPRQVAGMVLILSAVTVIIAGGRITQPLVRFRKLFPKIKRKM